MGHQRFRPKSKIVHSLQILIISLLPLVSVLLLQPSDASQVDGSGRVFSFLIHKMIAGSPRRHTLQRGETLLDIARRYDLGFIEIQNLCPGWDPWIPPVGAQIVIPLQRVLPESLAGGIVINTAELRLYYFAEDGSLAMTFPVGIGEPETPTPSGLFRISSKQVRPVWHIPPSLKHKYKVSAVPPGPDNPLGDYWLGLGDTRYGIHGSDTPWSVGRLVTHGCIRMYPEDIAPLFGKVKIGTPVKIIYEPVKIGMLRGGLYAEVHKDIYANTGDLVSFGLLRLEQLKISDRVDLRKYYQALKTGNGVPVNVTIGGASYVSAGK